MNKEIECLYNNKTWKLVERVKGKDVLDVKWVYTRKSDDRYKASVTPRNTSAFHPARRDSQRSTCRPSNPPQA